MSLSGHRAQFSSVLSKLTDGRGRKRPPKKKTQFTANWKHRHVQPVTFCQRGTTYCEEYCAHFVDPPSKKTKISVLRFKATDKVHKRNIELGLCLTQNAPPHRCLPRASPSNTSPRTPRTPTRASHSTDTVCSSQISQPAPPNVDEERVNLKCTTKSTFTGKKPEHNSRHRGITRKAFGESRSKTQSEKVHSHSAQGIHKPRSVKLSGRTKQPRPKKLHNRTKHSINRMSNCQTGCPDHEESISSRGCGRRHVETMPL